MLDTSEDGAGVDPVGQCEEERSAGRRFERKLWKRGAVILEELDLSLVPDGRYELIALPLRLVGMDGAPVRAVLIG